LLAGTTQAAAAFHAGFFAAWVKRFEAAGFHLICVGSSSIVGIFAERYWPDLRTGSMKLQQFEEALVEVLRAEEKRQVQLLLEHGFGEPFNPNAAAEHGATFEFARPYGRLKVTPSTRLELLQAIVPGRDYGASRECIVSAELFRNLADLVRDPRKPCHVSIVLPVKSVKLEALEFNDSFQQLTMYPFYASAKSNPRLMSAREHNMIQEPVKRDSAMLTSCDFASELAQWGRCIVGRKFKLMGTPYQWRMCSVKFSHDETSTSTSGVSLDTSRLIVYRAAHAAARGKTVYSAADTHKVIQHYDKVVQRSEDNDDDSVSTISMSSSSAKPERSLKCWLCTLTCHLHETPLPPPRQAARPQKWQAERKDDVDYSTSLGDELEDVPFTAKIRAFDNRVPNIAHIHEQVARTGADPSILDHVT
jgi:hypothetical protein